MLAAAVETFAERGYGGATTKEIARRAGVAEPTMFRIYPTKEKLYEAAVLGPFDRFLEDFTAKWMAAEIPGGDPALVLQQFVVELHGLVARNRHLIAALASADPLTGGAQPALSRLETVGEAIARTYGLDFDVPVAVRIATATVVATTMFEDTLFPAPLGGERLLAEMTRMLVGATLHTGSRD
ncbi:TetR/AcrR family transcriptional regulator [Nocardia miyunensis]|uniref:TetR/AcrR family transcriptional regulator n=1 Tax=Nocardia miyunensis TaxID=282684 RepID=UPI001471F30A|nr:TetR/AcrR family transcriptional regulator [Nocardia miyunensis]